MEILELKQEFVQLQREIVELRSRLNTMQGRIDDETDSLRQYFADNAYLESVAQI